MIYMAEDSDLDDYYRQVRGKTTIDCEIADQYWGDRTFTTHNLGGYVLTFAKTVKQIPVEEILEAMKQQQ
jgi:uncharacterized glyoxalase superfamily protein PhnB